MDLDVLILLDAALAAGGLPGAGEWGAGSILPGDRQWLQATGRPGTHGWGILETLELAQALGQVAPGGPGIRGGRRAVRVGHAAVLCRGRFTARLDA